MNRDPGLRRVSRTPATPRVPGSRHRLELILAEEVIAPCIHAGLVEYRGVRFPRNRQEVPYLTVQPWQRFLLHDAVDLHLDLITWPDHADISAAGDRLRLVFGQIPVDAKVPVHTHQLQPPVNCR